jgi:polyphosphate kinase
MPRNLYERVEVLFPLKDELLRQRVRQEILQAYLVDNLKSRLLQKDGSYIRVWRAQGRRRPPSDGFNSQEFLISLAEGKAGLDAIPETPSRTGKRTTVAKER